MCVDHCHLPCALHHFPLANRARKQKLNRAFFWGHDPVTHVRRARYLTVHVGGPSLSVSLSLSLSMSSVRRSEHADGFGSIRAEGSRSPRGVPLVSGAS